ncbi:MAG TPA: hypothetical protein VG371_01085 [Solirubrobacteraceae bacterium]|jgi:hypothetical protein|nr:hypothetical protein [Solirubrobacteraceae bacterium]
MPIDLRRPLRAAIEAALDEALADPPKKKRHGGTGRALLIGAGLFTAGRLVVGGRGRDVLQAIQQRLPDVGQAGADDDQPQGDEDFDEHGDEPQDEAEDDFDEEPEDEADEDVDEEPEDEAGEDVDEPPADDESAGGDAEETPRRRTRGRATTSGRTTTRSRR